MTAVGQFPMHRRVMPSTPNPLDKSTVVSVFPLEIYERKETITPGIFQIPPGSYEKPSILVVGSSSWWKDFDDQLIEITNSSIQIADDIVKGYASGLLACDMNEAMPGLFFVLGAHDLKSIQTEYKPQLDRARQRQNNWYQSLVRLADSLWSRSNGNPLAIADTMRMAARELQLEKDWLVNTSRIDVVRCLACGTMKNPNYPVCPTCRHVDQEMAKKMNLKFAVE